MPSPDERWLDSDAGPIVRPYALTRGRTRPKGEKLDVIAIVRRARAAAARLRRRSPAASLRGGPTAASGTGPELTPEQFSILELLSAPATVADLASDLDLPLGVVRVLLADLREEGLVTISMPGSAHEQPDIALLQQVLEGLRRL